jgi:poly(hydroxyalkanoate) depolymerase family esterase
MHFPKRALSLLSAPIVVLACTSAPEEATTETSSTLATHAGLAEITGFGSNPAGLKMYEYVPSTLGSAPGVLVVLHGCTQTAADIAKTGWNALADRYGFVVVYPEQNTSNNPIRCFNWGGVYGNLSTLARGKGENESVKEMVDRATRDHAADPKRVFVAGFSAGGGLAAEMAATWPDVFAAGATLAGLPYRCNSSFIESFTCMKPGIDKTPAQWAELARQGAPNVSGPFPRMSIWQGASDTVVAPKNRLELIDQWTGVHGVSATPTATETVSGAKHTIFADDSGAIVVESYEIPSMDHGVAVDPRNGCGTAGSYALDKGICTAALVVKFFGLDQ